ncbi:unnamed protein product [Knipowitschia caucasica]
MAASFTISDSESEPSEELEETLKLELREAAKTGTGRIRLSSESQASVDLRPEQGLSSPNEGFPFRGRSKSAPPALWAAKKYGQQLRRMSDEFDSLLDKGEMKKPKSRPMHHSKTWWSYLFSHQESEAESHHEPPHDPPRTE